MIDWYLYLHIYRSKDNENNNQDVMPALTHNFSHFDLMGNVIYKYNND